MAPGLGGGGCVGHVTAAAMLQVGTSLSTHFWRSFLMSSRHFGRSLEWPFVSRLGSFSWM